MPKKWVGRRLDLKAAVCPYPTAKARVIPKKYGYSLGVGGDRRILSAQTVNSKSYGKTGVS